MDENPIKTGLTLEQKLGFAFLFIFAVLFLIISFFQIRANLYRPYALSNVIPDVLIKEKFSDPIEALHYRDTDRDGLTDFEEIYIYGTSAYLSDTDGDGVGDKDEILQGKNPLCAEGAACDKQSFDSLPIQNLESWVKSIEQGEMENFNIEEVFQNPEQIRLLLLSSGVEKELLDSLSDEELLYISQEIFNSDDFKEAMNLQVVVHDNDKPVNKEEAFSNPTLLREMMLNSGYVDKEALDKLTDEEVKKAAEQMFDFSQ